MNFWTRRMSITLLAAVPALVVTLSDAQGQAQLRSWVFATGGGVMSGGGHTAVGTVGQSFVGYSSGVTYAASSGVWFGGVITDVDQAESDELPRVFALRQNYPNPFNPRTLIEYRLPKACHVDLRIFDLLGREMLVLVEGMQEAGNKSVALDASGLPSGAYFYRLAAGDFMATKKLVVVK